MGPNHWLKNILAKMIYGCWSRKLHPHPVYSNRQRFTGIRREQSLKYWKWFVLFMITSQSRLGRQCVTIQPPNESPSPSPWPPPLRQQTASGSPWSARSTTLARQSLVGMYSCWSCGAGSRRFLCHLRIWWPRPADVISGARYLPSIPLAVPNVVTRHS